MAGGLHYDSLADLPPQMRKQVAGKIATTLPKAEPVAGQEAKVSKFHNQKIIVNGIPFDSKKEARRFGRLIYAQQMGVISDLRLQHDFTLQDAYTTPEGERICAIRYRADFTYKVQSADLRLTATIGYEDMDFWRSIVEQKGRGTLVVEDVKSKATKTKDYRMKYKMMADKGYHIREV